MISAVDTFRLAHGVTMGVDRLHDDVRGASWPLNATGEFVLSRTGVALGVIVADLAHSFSLSREEARGDVLRFVVQLNALALVNVEKRDSRFGRLREWVQLAARLVPAGALPAMLTRRRPLDTRSVLRGLWSCLLAGLPRLVLVACAATACGVAVSLLAGSPGLAPPVVAGTAAGLGLVLHEAAHAAALCGVPSALITRGRRTYVLHGPLETRRRSLVALAGPLAVACLGVVLVGMGTMSSEPGLAVAGCPFAAHALGLTVVAGDGRVACGI